MPTRILRPYFIDPSCILSLRMMEGAGNLVKDSSGYGNHGTRTGATWTSPGYFPATTNDWCLSFDGSGTINIQNIDITGITDTTQTYTFEFWMNARDSTSSPRYFCDVQTGRLLFGWGADAGAGIGIYDGAWKIFGNSPSINMWHHCVFLLNATTAKMKMYLDNNQYGAELNYTARNIGGTVRIGSRHAASGINWWAFDGYMDEVRIYNRILSVNEIEAHYNGGRQKP